MSEEKPSISKSSDIEIPDNNKHIEEKNDEPKNARLAAEKDSMESLGKSFTQKLKLLTSLGKDNTKVISNLTFDGLCDHWKRVGFKNIITMVGAGISTSAGVPDFRSPGTGIYDNLDKYNLPADIFTIDTFEENPKPFFVLAKKLYPGSFNPTATHYFVRLLHEKGLLVRHYTQNIDTLERIAGIPEEKLVEAHGTFYTNHCRGCNKSYSMDWMKDEIFADRVPTCSDCNSVVKPDIVFFGEQLPEKFSTMPDKDFSKCDLLIIMGTSLEVQPFASLITKSNERCIRLLINRTKVSKDFGGLSYWFFGGATLLFDDPENTRDIAYIGNCDDAIWKIVEALGWTDELKEIMQKKK